MTVNFASGTIWTGDNLAVLRGMNDACVDLIYLDPPFNSNRTYEAPIGSKAARTIPITCNCSAQAATEARADAPWLNGERRNER